MSDPVSESIRDFLAGAPHAVLGASRDRHKYGNKCLRCYQQARRPVYAVNPRAESVEGLPCYGSLFALPEPVYGISIITPPKTSETIVADAIDLGIQHLWFQPGAESGAAVSAARDAGLHVIAGGPCLLVVLGFRER
jgi:predicted CoA-binding protein